MKKILYIMVLLLIAAGILSGVEVTIGTATTYNSDTSYPAPYGNFYKNSRMQYLFTAAELNNAGGGAGDITSLAFNNQAVNGCGARPLVIWMGHTDLTALTASFVTGLTQVYSSASYQPVAGWDTHTFNTAFTWNGTQNVVVQVFFGDLAQGYTYNASSYYTTTSNVSSLYYRSDTSDAMAQSGGTTSSLRANVKFNMPAYNPALPPSPANLVYPGNGATMIPRNPTLTWAPGGGAPAGYKLYFGLSPIRDMVYIGDLGNVTSWTPPGNLLSGMEYSWQVVPYNSQGDATGCPIWTFTVLPPGTAIIGSGTYTGYVPVYAWYGYTYSQTYYYPSEIAMPGIITSIAYYWNGTATNPASNAWTVYMGHSTNSTFDSSTSWEMGLTQVFSGTVDCPAAPGWVTIPLTTPFIYNGTSNLVIGVDENLSGYDSTYGYFFSTPSPGARSIYFYDDGINPDPAAPPVGTTYAYFPNLMINLSPLGEGAPAAPNLGYPINGQNMLPVGGFDLTWSADLINGGMPDYYAVYLSRDEDPVTNTEAFFETTSTSLNPTTYLGGPDDPITFAYNQTWYWTVEAINDWNNDTIPDAAVVDPPWRFDITPAPPQITVNPASLSQTLENGQQATQQLTISNPGELPLNYTMSFTDTTGRGTQIISVDQMPLLAANPEAGRYSETASFIGPMPEDDTRAVFDFQFTYPTAINQGEYGIATDGSYFYTSNWGYDPGTGSILGFNKYNLSGTYLSTFTIPGVPGIRDLAYDGMLFYGGAATTTIYVMNFDTQTLVSTITAPVAVRGIAYDPDLNALWVGNQWAADIRCISLAGAQLSSLVPAVTSFAGLAYDNLSGLTPTLWGNTQNGTTGNLVAQIDIATGAVLQSLDVTDAQIPGIAGSGASAGGIEIFPGLVNGKASLICNTQNFAFYGMELCDVASWISANPSQGSVPAGGSQVVDVLFDAAGMDPGIYTGDWTINHNAPSTPLGIPVQLTVSGTWPAEFSVNPTSYGFGDVEQMNPAATNFTVSNLGGSVPTPLTISSVNITGDAEGNFSVSAPGLPLSLNHNETYSIGVTFTPQTLGAKTATLNIVDNLTRTVHTVPLSGNGTVEPMGIVVNLSGTVQNGEDVALTWVLASGEVGSPGWLHYDSGINDDAIGAGENVTFDVAAKFSSGTLYPYTGMVITNVNFYPYSSITTYTLEIWTGVDGSLAPSALVYTQPLAGLTIDAWNNVALSTPFPITGTEAVWVGYNCAVGTGTETFPAGCDAGPATAEWGDLLFFAGNWSSMAIAYGMSYNWNIQAYVDNPLIRATAPLLSIPVINQEPDREFLSRHRLSTTGRPSNPSRVLRGYNVYRNNVIINPALVQSTSYLDAGLLPGSYGYNVQAVYYSGTSPMSDPWGTVINPPVAYDLPFNEGWDSGTLTANEWVTTASNWLVTNAYGDPAPCLMFSWSPTITNYDHYATSRLLNGTGSSNVTLSFEMGLDNYSIAAENWLAVEVWNGSTWNTIHTWSSFENGGADWGLNYYSYDISAFAAGNNFKIRFRAYGEDSYEINWWLIDNINVYQLPAGLTAPAVMIEAAAPDVFLSWQTVPGAIWYGVYAAVDPYGTYTYLGWLPANYIGVYLTAGNFEFFKITAGAGNLPRGSMLERGVESPGISK